MRRSTKLALPMTAIALFVSASAFAEIGTGTLTAGNTLRVSGSSAVDRTLVEAILDPTNGVCKNPGIAETAETPSVYTSKPDLSSFGDFMIVCKARVGTTNVPADTVIAIEKFSGGSETGIDPVALAATSVPVGTTTTAILFVDPANVGACTDAGFVNAITTQPDRQGYHLHTACTRVQNIPHAGSSDVNLELFGTSTDVKSKLASQGAHSIPFQILVSTTLYGALQTSQGLAGCTSADQTPGCVPSLSAGQVRSLLSGQVKTATLAFGLPNSGSTGVDANGGAIAGTAIAFCSRNKLSGTRKSFEAMFFDQGCQASVTPVLKSEQAVTVAGQKCDDVGCAWPATGTLFSAATFIFSGSGTGEVEKCLSYSTNNSVYAFGIASADRFGDDSTNKKYRAVRLDGVLPTVDSVLSQKYQFFTENVFVNPTGASPNLTCSGSGEEYACGNRAAIYSEQLVNLIRDPATIAKTHNSSPPYGRVGVLIRPNNTFKPLTTDTGATRPVNPMFRSTSLGLQDAVGTVNDCKQVVAPSLTGFLRN